MGKTVRITADNQVSVMDITPFERDGWYKAIGGGCDIVETVKTQRMFDLLRMPVLMLVDEEGHLRGQELNLVASLLYGAQEHGCPIVGNVIFAVPDGPDILPLSEEDAEMVKGELMREFVFLEEEKQEEREVKDRVETEELSYT